MINKRKRFAKKHYIIYLFVFISLTTIVFSWLLIAQLNLGISIIKIHDKVIKVELARTPSQQAQGLSGRESLCPDCAMLFVFPQKEIKKFWMKDMKFPLDIVWFNDNRVVGVTPNIPAPKNNESPQVVSSILPVNYVLELNAGMADYYGLSYGQEVVYQINQ